MLLGVFKAVFYIEILLILGGAGYDVTIPDK